jgi:hypothetical protein
MTTPTVDGSAGSPAPRPKSRKTLWIVLGVVGFIVFCMIAFAAFGLYFVSQNLDMQQATVTEASRSFEEVRARFKEGPAIQINEDARDVTLLRRPPDQAAADKPQKMHVMAFDREDSRIVRVTIPFWMLRMGREKIRLGKGGDLQLEDLNLTAEELERYGPTLLVDHKGRSGERVLIWTQ